MKFYKPLVKIAYNAIDFFLLSLSIITLGFIIIYIQQNYDRLPKQVPSHKNVKGSPDFYSGKEIFFFFPILAIIYFVIFELFTLYPHKFSYPVKITSENAKY